jgi:hypothetical protein
VITASFRPEVNRASPGTLIAVMFPAPACYRPVRPASWASSPAWPYDPTIYLGSAARYRYRQRARIWNLETGTAVQGP